MAPPTAAQIAALQQVLRTHGTTKSELTQQITAALDIPQFPVDLSDLAAWTTRKSTVDDLPQSDGEDGTVTGEGDRSSEDVSDQPGATVSLDDLVRDCKLRSMSIAGPANGNGDVGRCVNFSASNPIGFLSESAGGMLINAGVKSPGVADAGRVVDGGSAGGQDHDGDHRSAVNNPALALGAEQTREK